MRRADRLFQIVQLLRRDRSTTGARLAQELGISLRTLYRDIADLQLICVGQSRVPARYFSAVCGEQNGQLSDG